MYTPIRASFAHELYMLRWEYRIAFDHQQLQKLLSISLYGFHLVSMTHTDVFLSSLRFTLDLLAAQEHLKNLLAKAGDILHKVLVRIDDWLLPHQVSLNRMDKLGFLKSFHLKNCTGAESTMRKNLKKVSIDQRPGKNTGTHSR
jgi:hypothetical protein